MELSWDEGDYVLHIDWQHRLINCTVITRIHLPQFGRSYQVAWLKEIIMTMVIWITAQ